MSKKLDDANRRYLELKTLYDRERRNLSMLIPHESHTKRLEVLARKVANARKTLERLQNGGVR